jgi:hypothetical protein
MTEHLGGLSIIASEMALKETAERLFPASRHRSKRVHKKLLKRFGGEFRKAPTIWKTPNSIIMHPALYFQMKERVKP